MREPTFMTFMLPWPWPWPDDLHIWTWPVSRGDVRELWKWTSYVRAFESYRLTERQTDRQTYRRTRSKLDTTQLRGWSASTYTSILECLYVIVYIGYKRSTL